jgi:hypothetical protein
MSPPVPARWRMFRSATAMIVFVGLAVVVPASRSHHSTAARIQHRRDVGPGRRPGQRPGDLDGVDAVHRAGVQQLVPDGPLAVFSEADTLAVPMAWFLPAPHDGAAAHVGLEVGAVIKGPSFPMLSVSCW